MAKFKIALQIWPSKKILSEGWDCISFLSHRLKQFIAKYRASKTESLNWTGALNIEKKPA